MYSKTGESKIQLLRSTGQDDTLPLGNYFYPFSVYHKIVLSGSK